MKRLRIGLQTARLEYGYGVKLWQGALISAKKIDADLIVFPGRNLNSPHGYDYQYNSIFSLMNLENIDSLILITTLISNYVDKEELNKFRMRFSDLPIISVGARIENTPSILIDNRSGIRDLVRHQIEVHGAKRIAFIKGPENNWEADERYQAYKLELEANGILFDERLIGNGDFTSHSVAPAIEKILNSNDLLPEVFMFANDEMAIHGMRLLREKGIDIPGDTSITGFDDIHEAASQSVPITTVSQPLSEMIDRAVNLAVELAQGKETSFETILPTHAVIRSSCGCIAHCVNDVISIRKNQFIKDDKEDVCSQVLKILDKYHFDNYSNKNTRRANVEQVIRKIISLSSGNKNETADESDIFSFFNYFSRLLMEESSQGLQPEHWQIPLSILSEFVNSSRATDIMLDQFRFLVRACAVLTLDSALNMRVANQYEFERIIEHIHDLEYDISSVVDLNSLIQILVRKLPSVGINTFMLSKYKTDWEQKRDDEWSELPDLKCVASMCDSSEMNTLELNDSGSLKWISSPGRSENDRSRAFVIYPLFFRENHYGIIAYELSLQSGFIYESLTTQISGVLKRIFLYDAKDKAEQGLRQAMRDLEIFNAQLSQLSITDELTGLFNRRGFMKMAEHSSFLARQMGQSSMLIFADLDKLKKINDTYGHEEGDWAIKTVSEALKKTFRSNDVVARLGGDEFTVFATNMKEELLPRSQSRINDFLKQKCAEKQKEYELTISIGHVICPVNESLSIEEYMQIADSRLYEQKKKKHAGS
ncbi:MAG TPA: GGDEF domain-containing protein [Spirochaetota bacterium]|nr:GGDEF domain-containing protein [Spirochaetota bacterium]